VTRQETTFTAIKNKNTGKVICQYDQLHWVWKLLRSFCRGFNLHFQVFWLTPLL